MFLFCFRVVLSWYLYCVNWLKHISWTDICDHEQTFLAVSKKSRNIYFHILLVLTFKVPIRLSFLRCDDDWYFFSFRIIIRSKPQCIQSFGLWSYICRTNVITISLQLKQSTSLFYHVEIVIVSMLACYHDDYNHTNLYISIFTFFSQHSDYMDETNLWTTT